MNVLILRLKQELTSTKARLEETQNELSAWKFTPDSNTGKKLMAKCRLLHQENEDLGRMTSSGRIAKLEGDLALQKSFSEEVKKSQSGTQTAMLIFVKVTLKANGIHNFVLFQRWTSSCKSWTRMWRACRVQCCSCRVSCVRRIQLLTAIGLHPRLINGLIRVVSVATRRSAKGDAPPSSPLTTTKRRSR